MRARLHLAASLDTILWRLAGMVEAAVEHAVDLAQVVLVRQALEPESLGQSDRREGPGDDELRHRPVAVGVFGIAARSDDRLEGGIEVGDVGAQTAPASGVAPGVIIRSGQVLLRVGEHLGFQMRVRGMDVEECLAELHLIGGDANDLTPVLPDADLADRGFVEPRVRESVLPVGIEPVAVPVVRLVVAHQEVVDHVEVGGAGVLASCDWHR